MAAKGKKGGARIVVRKGKDRFILAGAPIIYSGAIAQEQGSEGRAQPMPGEAVGVYHGSGDLLGWGFYNPASEVFRVRLVQTAAEIAAAPELLLDVPALLRHRLNQAWQLRQACGLPSASTTAYRLCNSEGDRLSGLTVDVLGEHLVVQTSARWAEVYRSEICDALRAASGLSSIYWRPQADLLQKAEGCSGPLTPNEELYSGGDEVVVYEHGLAYHAAVRAGQKTGFYADQRESRLFLRNLARGKRVLDLCSYSGGFALNAALGGAAAVTAVDSSEAALALAARNAELNQLGGRIEFIKADITTFMSQYSGEPWDIIILDPPKLAPSRRMLPRASQKYKRLNAQAMELLTPGGLLMSCSCSGAMTQSRQFLPLLHDTARSLGKAITLLRYAGAGCDHSLDPAYPEGEYLTNVTLRVL